MCHPNLYGFDEQSDRELDKEMERLTTFTIVVYGTIAIATIAICIFQLF